MTDRDHPLGLRPAAGISRRQFLAIVSLFWLYVTLSNVLYAYSMRAGIARATSEPLFAPWDARVLQHVLLLPLLAVSFWASLRVQWRPLWVAVPLQIMLGTVFAGMAYPAMQVSQALLSGPDGHGHMTDHMAGSFDLNSTSRSFWLASFVSFLPAYGFGLALLTGLVLYARFRDSELRVAALERDWSAARLAALRMQLSPHTLFNLLHTIRGYIEWDPRGAQSMVLQLGDLLRRLLSAGERDFSRLQDELQIVKHYLELQQRRFSDRLTVILPSQNSIPDAWVPSLIMQPLVENAVVHGLAGHREPVSVRVTVQCDRSVLTLRISNTIADALTARPSTSVQGIGIKNVRERLTVQFEGRANLTCGPQGAPGAGGRQWISEITLPALLDLHERRAVIRTPVGSSR